MKSIPEPSRKRLVTLAQLLTQQKSERITSVVIERLTGWSQSLIRRDISLLEMRCGASNGYNINELRKHICAALNIQTTADSAHSCCIVGLGRLGAALLEKSLFKNTMFRVVVGFDSSVNRTEVLHAEFPLYPTSMLESIITQEKIDYAILAVPDEQAQETAERLAACGVRGIVNYTSTILSLSQNIAIENVAPVTALTNLSTKVQIMDA